MPKFSFAMQPVLNYRAQVEKCRKGEYAQAIMKLEEEKEKLFEIESIKKNYMIQMTKNSADGATVSALRQVSVFIKHMAYKKEEQEQNVQLAFSISEAKRNELVEAMKNRKIMEKLKECKYNEYLFCEKKAEQMINDQTVSFKHTLKSGG